MDRKQPERGGEAASARSGADRIRPQVDGSIAAGGGASTDGIDLLS